MAETLAELTLHTVVAVSLAVAVWIVEQTIYFLWAGAEKVLWGVLPLKYVFDTADFFILAWFMAHGYIEVMRVYKGGEK